VSTEDERALVLAVDAGTYLTLAFRPGDYSNIREPFAAALADGLANLGVPPRQIGRECEAVLGLPLQVLSDTTLREALDTVDFICGTELEYHRDLRVVQRNLSQFPHSLLPHHVPAIAVQHLFGVVGTSGAKTAH
jgi:hypothetical protein